MYPYAYSSQSFLAFPPPPAARHYHPTLSIWLSVDPMSDKYPSTSPYTYCANNPVRLVDPDGEEFWKPDWEGNLIAERGDNAWTLAKFLNITPKEAITMLKSQGYKINNGILDLNIGDKVKLDNVFTRSIASSKGYGKVIGIGGESGYYNLNN